MAKLDKSYKNEFFYEMLAYHRTIFGLSLDYTSHAISCPDCLKPALDGLRVINTNSQNFDIWHPVEKWHTFKNKAFLAIGTLTSQKLTYLGVSSEIFKKFCAQIVFLFSII